KLLQNRMQTAVRKTKSDYYLPVFCGFQFTGEVWNKLRHLDLVKAKTSGRSTGDIDLGWEEEFDDSKFYWNYVTPIDINKAFGLM
ncbi:hypothetical protein ALC56_10551, partial [Trachymyrmex septentrionalis]